MSDFRLLWRFHLENGSGFQIDQTFCSPISKRLLHPSQVPYCQQSIRSVCNETGNRLAQPCRTMSRQHHR